MMARPNISRSMVSSDSSEKGTELLADSKANACYATSYQLIRSTSDGPVAILWDIENCPVPSDVRPEDVAGNIRMALRVHPVIKGAVMMFSAYGDFNAFPRRLREGCQRTGVKLVDVPNGRKDAADKAILVDMFLFALDNPPPSSIMLISGDVDFAPALHILGQRGYTVILVIPSGVGVSSALSNAGKFVWNWSSVARGEGFAPAMKAVMSSRGAGMADVSGYFAGVNMNDNLDGQMEEEAIVYRGISQKYYNSRDFSIVTQSVSEYNSSSIMPYLPATSRSHSLPSGLNEVSSCPMSSIDQNELTRVQPGDLNGLKRQLARLLELSGGCLPLDRVPAEYLKVFGRPLYVAEYGVFKLINLFKKMEDLLCVESKGPKKFVYLRNSKAYPSAPPLILAKKENKKGKGVVEENADVGSSEEYSDEERVVPMELSGRNVAVGTNYDANLEQFKHELQEILVSYSCRIFLGYFEAIYLQRYKKPLDYAQFGVYKLEELFEKVSDVVVLQEEAESKKKFVVALGG